MKKRSCAAATALALLLQFATAGAALAFDPGNFLVQAQCPGAASPADALPNACAAPQPVHAGDPLLYRRSDWGHYQITDSVWLPDGRALQAYDFAPFGPFVAGNGDGGDVLAVNGDTVLATETRDGGTPADQFFIGPACGGTGWIVFKTDAVFGAWQSSVATLSDQSSPDVCAPLGSAFTRYQRAVMTFPFRVGGKRVNRAVSVIEAEHYDHDTIAGSQAMERSFFGRHLGRILWQAWSAPGQPYNAPADLAQRCPAGAYSAPPVAGWQMADCRLSTTIVAGNGWNVSSYGWP